MQPGLCRKLEWDSAFFGFPIARLQTDSLNRWQAESALAWCCEQGIRCLYLLVNAADQHAIQVAESYGFHLVDIRMTFEVRPVPPASYHPGIRAANPSDIPALRRIAAQCHHDTRFYADPGFPRALCDELYATWIEKSCQGYADCVLVAEAGARTAGYAALHLPPGGPGSIGLIAVDQDYRGCGLGRKLVESALARFSERNMPSAEVVTQGRNLVSQRLYQTCGFRVCAVQLWFHRWFSEPPAPDPA
jgi:dTDP-4-amino-4,6-dideoxy-D-galactose acyltransferase